MNTTTDAMTSRMKHLATNVGHAGHVVASNGFFVAAGVALATATALRVISARHFMAYGPPRIFPIAAGLTSLVPILLSIGLAQKIQRMGRVGDDMR
jgi:hypothetical protein